MPILCLNYYKQQENIINDSAVNSIPSPRVTHKKKSAKGGGMTFRLLSSERTSQGVLLNLTVTPEVDTQVKLPADYVRVIDYDGNEYVGNSAQIGSKQSGGDIIADLVSKIPVKVIVHIKGVPLSVTKIALFEIRISDRKAWRIIRFRDIELSSDG